MVALPSTVWLAFLAATLIKVLLIPSYYSTDFDVHRNWLAITSSLPLQEWYFEATSFWTLDYPPFFAWFEYALSVFAPFADPTMLIIQAQPYVSAAATYFQRGSVMFTDLLLLGAIWSFVQTMPSLNAKPDAEKSSSQWSLESKHWVVICLLIFNAGLFIVDHIHFQYNGMLLGMLIYSVSLIRQGRDLPAGVVFAALLNFKHLFLYLAPAYFIYLWRHYCTHSNEPLLRFDDFDAHQSPTSPVFTACLQRSNIQTPPLYSISNDKAPAQFNLAATKSGNQGSWYSIRPLRLLALGISVIAMFALSLAPLVAVGGLSQLIQLKERLFPFGRGLLHAYWAPNVWALYAAADRALVFASKHKLLSFLRFVPSEHALTRGLVGDASAAFAVLPSPSPPVVSLLILLAISPALKAIWQRPHPRVFLAALVWSTLAGFMFGWHVHEKAALVHVVLLALTAADSSLDASVFEVAALVCHVTLYPLLFRDEEMSIKLMLVLVYTVLAHLLVSSHIASDLRRRRIAQPSAVFARRLQWLIASVVTIVTQFVLPIVAPQLPFAPLMLLSVCGAVGNIYVCALAWRVMQRLLSIE